MGHPVPISDPIIGSLTALNPKVVNPLLQMIPISNIVPRVDGMPQLLKVEKKLAPVLAYLEFQVSSLVKMIIYPGH